MIAPLIGELAALTRSIEENRLKGDMLAANLHDRHLSISAASDAHDYDRQADQEAEAARLQGELTEVQAGVEVSRARKELLVLVAKSLHSRLTEWVFAKPGEVPVQVANWGEKGHDEYDGPVALTSASELPEGSLGEHWPGKLVRYVGLSSCEGMSMKAFKEELAGHTLRPVTLTFQESFACEVEGQPIFSYCVENCLWPIVELLVGEGGPKLEDNYLTSLVDQVVSLPPHTERHTALEGVAIELVHAHDLRSQLGAQDPKRLMEKAMETDNGPLACAIMTNHESAWSLDPHGFCLRVLQELRKGNFLHREHEAALVEIVQGGIVQALEVSELESRLEPDAPNIVELLLEAKHAAIAAAAAGKGVDLELPNSEGRNAMELVWRNLSQLKSEDPAYPHYRRILLGKDQEVPPNEQGLDEIHRRLLDAITNLGAWPCAEMCPENDIAKRLIADALGRGVARGRPWLDVNRRCAHNNGESLVHAAAQYGTADIIELILELKGDPNTSAHTGETALSAACRRGDTGVAR